VKREPEPPCTPASADTIARVQQLTSKWPPGARAWIPSPPPAPPNRTRIRVIVDQGYGVVVDPAQVRQAGFTPGQSLDLIPAGELADLSRLAAKARTLRSLLATPVRLSWKEALVLSIMRDRAHLTRGCTQELYGLELVACSGGRLKRGSIYVTLASMEERGLITSHLEDDAGTLAAPPRRLYAATSLGMDALERRSPPTRRGRVLAAVAALGEPYSLQVADQLLAVGTATWWDRRLHPQVQPELRRLERAGLLVSREGEPLPERGGRPRFYYRLTEKGQAIVAGARWEDVP
jgi:DNA-binding PadR family transcriptional regulator